MAPGPPSPKNILRIGVTVSLVGAFLAVLGPLAYVRHITDGWQPPSAAPERLKELSSLLFFSMLAFFTLYAEHALAERALRRRLNDLPGYLESLGCVAIVLLGAASLLYAAATSGPVLLPESIQQNLLVILCVYGEATFAITAIASVVWPARVRLARPYSVPTHPAPAGPAELAARACLRREVRAVRWPRSAAAAFVIVALVIAVTGLVSALSKPFSDVPVQVRGRIVLAPLGAIYMLMAAPFILFASFYRLAESYGSVFRSSATKLHAACTVLAVLEALRVYFVWMFTASWPAPHCITLDDLNGVFGFAFLSIVAFIWSVYSAREPAKPTLGSAA